ncbi:MAG TPA: bifunctional 3,4-dihydroxy-2-butanone-4-phosphate synthase/GTP cyclohydrolase II [Caldithrix abyssi]|uniref:Riboflavin biosynthesis protein RibBA n=1 Tax=Caldithrix abyssi TaxID=187145 RepID=A0A7V1PWG3_CALAY|nr:bifunctional 3,4-dihydroxy-2-butanone-4-phosphate synthase/GTP cyclohydrolase II [Caldithrix abyssi]
MSDHIHTIEEAVEDIRKGGMVVVVDDPHRENEGDIIQAAESATAESVNFMARHARGLMCAAISGDVAKRLNLEPMVHDHTNTSLHKTNFTVSVDAAKNTTTGISAADRAYTLQTLANPDARPEDLSRPGHIFPITAREGGVLRRTGHTEAGVDLCRLAGMKPVAVMCEIMDDDGTMARLPRLQDFAREHGLKIVTIADLIAYRRAHEKYMKCVARAKMPTAFGAFDFYLYEDEISGETHVALVMGDVTDGRPVLVRVHSKCLTGDVFHSSRCDCGDQKDFALKKIAEEGRGVFVYLNQEGRGIGIKHKILAYELQEKGLDTVEANERLGFKADLRDYGAGAQILCDLGVQKINLITNNPKKLIGLKGFNLEVTGRVPVEIPPKKQNRFYLETKRDKMGHLLTLGEENETT